ncbi:MAG: cytochrome c oxidase subunit II [Gammaproteobacteria bacterium]|nr:cytochrome c oxidase subunit II [Gammaproteobacteria bacterium]
MKQKLSFFIATPFLWLFSHTALADWALNMPVGVTESSREIYRLHMLIFWVCVVIAVVVFAAMIYSIIAFRRSKHPTPATFTHSTKAEIVWTLIPVVILVAMALPAADTMLRIEDSRNADLTVKVTGYQWKWHYDYIDDGFGFFSNLDADSNKVRQLDSKLDPNAVPDYLRNVDKPMIVPVNTKVRLLLTSADVLHAWWVPELGGKMDAIPGFVRDMWFKADTIGTYRGQCAELCGRDHGFMPVVVDVVSQDDYDLWVANNTAQSQQAQAQAAADADKVWTKDELMSKGESVYGTFCSACHQANGKGLPPTFPGLLGSPSLSGPMDDHIDVILNGRSGTAMAAFGGQLTDAEIAAVVTYERNAWGQDTGDITQPKDVAAKRDE